MIFLIFIDEPVAQITKNLRRVFSWVCYTCKICAKENRNVPHDNSWKQ